MTTPLGKTLAPMTVNCCCYWNCMRSKQIMKANRRSQISPNETSNLSCETLLYNVQHIKSSLLQGLFSTLKLAPPFVKHAPQILDFRQISLSKNRRSSL